MARCVLVYRSRNRGSGGRPVGGDVARARSVAGRGQRDRLLLAVRLRAAGRSGGDVRAPLPARPRLHDATPRLDRGRDPQARRQQPDGDDARADDARGPRALAHDLRSAAPASTTVSRPTAPPRSSSPTAAMARDCQQKPACILAASQGMGPRNFTMNNYFKDPLPRVAGCARGAATLGAWRACDPQDVDVAQLYDAFTPLVLASLEEYGFCKPGEAGAFVENGGLEVGGRLPCNTSGGSLSEAYVHGINLIIEAVRQIRGTSCNQVPGRAALAGDERQHGADRARCCCEGTERWPTTEFVRRTGGEEWMPYWEAGRRRELRFQRCAACGDLAASAADRCARAAGRSTREWALGERPGARCCRGWSCHPPRAAGVEGARRRTPSCWSSARRACARWAISSGHGRRRCAWTCRCVVDFAPSPDGDLVPQWRPAS